MSAMLQLKRLPGMVFVASLALAGSHGWAATPDSLTVNFTAPDGTLINKTVTIDEPLVGAAAEDVAEINNNGNPLGINPGYVAIYEPDC